MNWFIWEQHKKWFLIAGIALALYATLLIPSGIHFWHTYQHALATCGQTNSCGQLSGNLLQSSTDQLLFDNLIPHAMLVIPVLFGMFWGVPLIAKEYTEGTNLLVWMRSISRRKWLTMKLVWILVATAVFAGAFAALITWWSRTSNDLNPDRFNTYDFGIQGFVPVAYSVFAVALGILFGAWFKRIMLALGATLAISMVLFLIVVPNFVRPHYITPITVASAVNITTGGAGVPSGAWELISQGLENKAGVITSGDPSTWPTQCQARRAPITIIQEPGGRSFFGAGLTAVNNCLDSYGYHSVATYQPGYRYWDFQWIETGLYLGVAALAIGATYWLVLKRDA